MKAKAVLFWGGLFDTVFHFSTKKKVNANQRESPDQKTLNCRLVLHERRAEKKICFQDKID